MARERNHTAAPVRKRVALYVRTSKKQRADGTDKLSIEAQIDELTRYSAERSWDIAGVYIDNGVSGRKANRPGLGQLLRDAELRMFDIVLVFMLNRVTRSIRFSETLGRIEATGVRVYFSHEPLLEKFQGAQDETGEMMRNILLAILAAQAQREWHNIRVWTRLGRDKRLALGGTWGPAPFGFRLDRGAKTWVCHPGEARVVKTIFRHYLRPGASTQSVADLLNAEKLRTRQGLTWTADAVRGVLINPAMSGEAIFNRTARMIDGQTVDNPESDWKRVKVDALVSREVQDAARDKLQAQRKSHSGGHATHSYLLSGVAQCGLCGRKLSGIHYPASTRVKNGRTYTQHSHHVYACVGRTLAHRRRPRGDAPHVCQFARLDGELLDAAVWDRVRGYLVEAGILQLLRRSLSQGRHGDDWQGHMDQIRTEMRRLANRRVSLENDLGVGDLSTADFNAATAAIDKRLTTLAEELHQAEQELEVALEVGQRHSDSELRARLIGRLGELTAEDRQRIVEMLVERAVVTEGDAGPEVRIVWKVPVSDAAVAS